MTDPIATEEEIRWLRSLRDAVANLLAHQKRKFPNQIERKIDYWKAYDRLFDIWGKRP
jgi:hypothetical protein